MDNEKISAIEKAWHDRAAAQDFKPGTKTYAAREVEFFAGVMAALQVLFPNEDPTLVSKAIPPKWLIHALSGRPIAGDGK